MRYLLFLSGCLWWLVGPLGAQSTPDSLAVQFQPAGGSYAGPVQVSLYAPGASAIYYTLDGSTPSTAAFRYRAPLTLTSTTSLRAVAYFRGGRGTLCGQTYLLHEPATQLPVVAIAIRPGILFDPYTGWFVSGPQATDSLWHKPGANYWTRAESPAHVDIFETDGSNVFSGLIGLKLFGGMSRLFPQKSLVLAAREQYGDTRIRHPLFGPQGPKSFKFLVLRNSGSDFGKSHFRDGLMTGLVRHWDLETQGFRPAHVYLNGQYWGIYNLREKVNRFFIEDHYPDVDRDSIDLLEHYLNLRRGSKAHYRRLLAYLDRHSLSDPSHYAVVQGLMDVDNFMHYQIAQIFFDNQDAGGNIKYWRPQKPDGRWRWILYDTDWGFGLHDPHAYRFNSLAFHTEAHGPNWPNPPWSTAMLRHLLANAGFRYHFVNRFCDHLNTTFASPRVLAYIDSLHQLYLPEMPRHLQRWRLKASDWAREVEVLRRFATERPAYMRQHLQAHFAAGPLRQVEVAASAGGQVLLNEYLEVGPEGLQGSYFENFPISLRALPAYGYRFVRWEGYDAQPGQRDLLLRLTDDRTYRLRAVFEPYRHPLQDQVIINEVCPRNPATGDWIEIHNRSDQTVDLRGWVLTDLKNEFVFPQVQLPPHDYLVVCPDAARFRQVFPQAYHVLGGLNFGLHKRRETLGLYANLGAAVDSLSYDTPPTDSIFSLSLLLPELDNADPENWEIRFGPGTPNAPNPYYLESRVRLEQHLWLRMGLAAGVVLLCLYLLWLRRRRLI